MNRKKSWILLLVLLVLISAYLLWPRKTAFSTVVVRINGEIAYTLPLEKNTELLLTGEGGTNLLVIRDEQAYIAQADCPDKLCVLQGPVDAENAASRPLGQSIVCLPHKLTVTLE